MSRIIGIDLGTTNTCVAVLDERGTPKVLATPEGERTTPSVVAWTGPDEVVVGVPARRQAITNPSNTIYGIKRLIGRKVNADDVSWFARSAPFRIVAAPNGDAWVRAQNVAKSPQEVSAHVLTRMRLLAEAALGEPVTRAVVTVPAYFDDAQRQATKDAGMIAGLDVVRILNEPTAAALAYGAHRVKADGRRIIAVFDLGGGTFDISIMAVERGIFEVLATGGDSALGGEDWDRRLIERMADEVFDRHRVDMMNQPLAIGRMKEACEAAKKQLSGDREAWIRLPFLVTGADGQPVNYERRITRDEVETATKDLLERLESPTRRALSDARLAPADVEEVLLVGGMTRWPAVAALVERLFGKKPSKGANPDEVVALGAAAYAGILAGDTDDAALLDVTPHDIGIKVGDSQFSVIIPRNSMLPVRARKLFATTTPNQKFVAIELYQGESVDVGENRKLGQVVLDGLPPGPPGSVRVELSLTVDVESILHVSARELKTGQHADVTIRPSGGLSHREIVEIITRRREEEGNRQLAGVPDDEASAVSRVPTSRDLPLITTELGSMDEKPPTPPETNEALMAEEAVDTAVLRIADAVGALMESWGFKRNMGRLWAVLYFENHPLPAAEIGDRLSLSSGSVSMLLTELQEWGAIKKAWVPGERREYYEAETSIWKMVSRVFRERELQWIRTALDSFEEGGRAIAAAPAGDERTALIASRVVGLVDLTRVTAQLLESALQGESVDALPLKAVGELKKP